MRLIDADAISFDALSNVTPLFVDQWKGGNEYKLF